MKKPALVLALLAAMPLMAQADVTVYGSLRVGINSLKSVDSNFKSTTGVDDFSSRIGFRGNEDLGNGLQAIWQLETGMALDGVSTGAYSSTGVLANRNSFVGLQGSWGKLRLGYLDDVLTETEATDTLYGARRDQSSGLAVPLYEASDIFGSNNLGDSRVRNSLRYDSPDFYGFNSILQYSAGENQSGGRVTGNTLGLRLAYSNAGFFAGYAYMTRLNAAASKNSAVQRLEFGYKQHAWLLGATLQTTRLYGDAHQTNDIGELEIPGIVSSGVANTGLNKLTSQAWAVKAAYTVGNFTPSLLYSQRRNVKVDGQSLNWGASQLAAAVDYQLSKRSVLEAGYGRVKEKRGAQRALGWDKNTANITWLMMRHDF